MAMAKAGPSRGPDTWQPNRYLEPNHPDNEEVLEQAAYQAAVTKLGGDARARRYKPRRTVDYMGGMVKWRWETKMRGIGWRGAMHPNPSDIINLLPPEAHVNPSTSICDNFVHTSINKERSPVRVVKWTPDARRLLTGNDKGQFTLWNGQSFNYESITQVHDDSIRAFAYSHNGQALVSTDKSGTIKYFTPHLTNVHGFQGHREACQGLGWSPNDERFITGGDDGLVKIWDYREAKEERVLSGHGWDVRCVDWHPRKGLVVSGSKDMLVKFWDPRTGKELSTLHSHKSTINACSWNPDGHVVATAGGDGSVHLFDIRTFRELDALKGHTKEVNCLEWHPIHHSILATGDSGGTINYYSLNSPTPSEPTTTLLEAHEDAIHSMNFHPLGHILCTGSKDFTARFWSRARPMGGHELDRWHLGEERAMQVKREGLENMPMRQWGGEAKKEEEGVPGLPGLSNIGAGAGAGSGSGGRFQSGQQNNPSGPPSALPGFGMGATGGHSNFPPPPNGAGPGGGGLSPFPPPQPQRQWGNSRSNGAAEGGYGGRAPLPTPDQMYSRAPPGQGSGPGAGVGYDEPERAPYPRYNQQGGQGGYGQQQQGQGRYGGGGGGGGGGQQRGGGGGGYSGYR